MSTAARPTVYLHIGTPKSGTTSVQEALKQNRDALAAEGVLYPGRPIDQIRGAQEILREQSPTPRWDAIADEVRRFGGHAAVVSMESLCTARRKQARRAVRAFRGLDVEVIVTARDLARTLPAQWQESTQFRHTWTYREYLDGVSASRPRRTASGRSFWRQHDLRRIIKVWGRAVGTENITVVTLPKQSAPDLLWRRFAEVVGIDADRSPLPEIRNESLGAASAELMRRVNEGLTTGGLTRDEYGKNCRDVLAKTVLATRSRLEPRLALPTALQPWAVKRSAQLARAVRDSGVSVVGDLADLQSETATTTDLDPEQLPPDELLDAAVDAIVGLVTHRAEQERNRRGAPQQGT